MIIIYSENDGSIVRKITGGLYPKRQRIKDGQKAISDEAICEGISKFTVVDELDFDSGMKIDTSSNPPELVDDPEYDPVETNMVDRAKISESTKEVIDVYRDQGDIQSQIDVILDILDVVDLDSSTALAANKTEIKSKDASQ
ncbi:hypothetical protein [Halostagnicola sp. A-GB9-2]|uniref:hypothetical protein n=1 Tax=Halostagnicola sp. A-GB9-2 TaxID=3048066 RepID=UPI0024C05698|nr:hypothetical protein [Halostagnicola sp. A-GB9-2]MDJ1434768.1 hypothetical protein [Halostagnicola sp. A-GB9-2]